METKEKEGRRKENVFLEKVRPIVELAKRKLVPKATGGLLLTLALATACRGGESDEQQSPTPTPPSTPTPTPTLSLELKTPPPSIEAESQITPTPTPEVTPTVTPIQEKGLYDSLHQTIENSGLTETEKVEARTIIDEFSQIEKNRQQLINYYRQRTDETGQPLLLTLIKEKFASIDPTQLPGYDPNNPNSAYESMIFFLRDQKLWEEKITQRLEQIRDEKSGEVVLETLQQLKGEASEQRIYLESNRKKGLDIKINIDFDPQNDKELAQIAEAKQHIEELKNKMPLFGNIEIHLNNSNISSFDYSTEEDKSVIQITVVDRTRFIPRHVPHELAHVLLVADVSYQKYEETRGFVKNSHRFIRYFPPEKVVEIMIQQEKILADEVIGRQYPKTVEGAYVTLAKPKLSASDLGSLATEYATQRWNEWATESPKDRIEKTDAEHLAEILGNFFEYSSKLIPDDPHIDLIKSHTQSLSQN